MVLGRYKEIVQRIYSEPKNEIIMGCFLEVDGTATEPSQKRKKKTEPKKPKKPEPKSRDIRVLFRNAQKATATEKTIVLD